MSTCPSAIFVVVVVVMEPVSDSCKCSDNITQENSNNHCDKYNKPESEHKKILDELKSSQVIIELLRTEVNANLASEYVMKNIKNNIMLKPR